MEEETNLEEKPGLWVFIVLLFLLGNHNTAKLPTSEYISELINDLDIDEEAKDNLRKRLI